MALNPARLRSTRTLDDVVRLLSEDLGWGFGIDHLDDDATFEYTAEELGIPSNALPRLKSIRQLRPLVTHQPWGVIFLEFQGRRLPLTPLRRLLQSLVTAKRRRGQQRTWDLQDLLFIVLTEGDESVELHFVAFFDVDNRLTEVRSLQWRPDQSPPQHLRRLCDELLPRLKWPEDDKDIDGWREQWRSAFRLRHGEAIAGAAHLAERMAEVAQVLRDRIGTALKKERTDGPFHRLLREVKDELVAQVDERSFADMCAQTLVYGTLTARVTDPIGFGASPTLSVVPLANPFLAAFFEQVHDQVADLDLERAGLEQLVADLRTTNVEAVLDQFGSTARGGDPVVHFYEEFLKRYDPKARADAGAFYTPQPAVRFMVHAVDHLLRAKFGLAAGIADEATWGEVAKANGFGVPAGVAPRDRFICMIDPATGSGTYLVEWLRQAAESAAAALPNDRVTERLRDVVVPSMHAFEFNVAPYAVAHLKVALEAQNHGLPADGVRIHLTNTLEHPSAQAAFGLLDDAVAREGQRAAALKTGTRFTVCIGNPPYDRQQRSDEDEVVKGGVVRHGVAGVPPLLSDVLTPLTNAGLGKHAKNVYNDYVYFWRWATWQATQLPPGPGIVAFITASSYLDGVSLGGLRHHLRDVFDEFWVVDLGGEGRGARSEENIFDIRTPVAIGIGVRVRGSSGAGCKMRYYRVPAETREGKLKWLREIPFEDCPWVEAPGTSMQPLLPAGDSDYSRWPSIANLFPWIHSGSQLKRTWPIGPTRSVLARRWDALRQTQGKARGLALRETGFRSLTARVTALGTGEPLKPIGKITAIDDPERVERYGYRSFDRQWVIADNRLADRPRPVLWSISGSHQVYLATLTSTKLGRGPAVTATPYVPDLHYFSGRGAKDVIPLWRDPAAREPNITHGLLALLGDRLAREINPETLLAYVYGLAGTPAFAEHFADELGEAAGPFQLPITADGAIFERVVHLGFDLLWWHTWGERFKPDGTGTLPTGSAVEKVPIVGYPDGFSYDEDTQTVELGTGRIAPVSSAVWSFEVSGLKVLRSWLGYRMPGGKGRKSSPLDDIGPERWTFTDELLRLLAIIEHTIDVTPEASRLLDAVVGGPLIEATELPIPSTAERKAPSE